MKQENIETDAVRIETYYGYGEYSEIDAVELVGLAPGICMQFRSIKRKSFTEYIRKD